MVGLGLFVICLRESKSTDIERRDFFEGKDFFDFLIAGIT